MHEQRPVRTSNMQQLANAVPLQGEDRYILIEVMCCKHGCMA